MANDFPKLNPEATPRGRPIEGSWYFGTYMMKNLYALISPLEVRAGYEGSPGEKRAVILLPKDLLPPDPVERSRSWDVAGAKWTQLATSNPDLFWAAPPGF